MSGGITSSPTWRTSTVSAATSIEPRLERLIRVEGSSRPASTPNDFGTLELDDKGHMYPFYETCLELASPLTCCPGSGWFHDMVHRCLATSCTAQVKGAFRCRWIGERGGGI